MFFGCLVPSDSIMYNLRNAKENEAKVLIDRIYHESEDRQAILHNLKMQCHKKKDQDISYLESLFGPKYLRGTIVTMLISFFFQWTGVNMILMLSNRIITISNEDVPEDNKVKANLGT